MVHYSTCIYLVVYTLKRKRQNIFVLTSKSDILTIRYILRNACIAITCLSGHCRIKKMMETAFIMYYNIISSNDTIKKEGQVTMDPSSEFCFKRLIYRYLLETGHAPGDPPGESCLVPSHNLSLFKCCPPDDATYQISGL